VREVDAPKRLFGYVIPVAPTREDEDTGRRIGVAAIVCLAFVAIELLVIALLAFVWVPKTKVLIAEFCSATALPALTRVVFSWWWPALWMVVLFALAAVAIVRVRSERRRVAVLAVAMVLGAAEPMLTWWGIYLPIFDLAGNIKAE
jgi:hypothetical protein